MPEFELGGERGDAKHFLTKKVGPLPVWGYVAIGGVLLGLVLYLRRRSSSAGAVDTSATPVGAPTGSGATGFTQDQLGQLSSLVNGDVTSQLASSGSTSSAGTSPTAGSTGAVTNPLAQYVNEEYQQLLGRPADSSGSAYWSNQLAGGQTPQQQFLAIGGTQEAQQYAAGNPGAFVTGQYETLLNRQPDSAGLAYWTGVLQQNHGNTALESQQFLQAAQPELKH
jgi:hypothetical protein